MLAVTALARLWPLCAALSWVFSSCPSPCLVRAPALCVHTRPASALLPPHQAGSIGSHECNARLQGKVCSAGLLLRAAIHQLSALSLGLSRLRARRAWSDDCVRLLEVLRKGGTRLARPLLECRPAAAPAGVSAPDARGLCCREGRSVFQYLVRYKLSGAVKAACSRMLFLGCGAGGCA